MDVQTLTEGIGNPRGRFSSKENRTAKLVEIWPELEAKMIGMIKRGQGYTDQARHAYATLLMMETGIRVGNEGSAEGWICDFQILAKEDGEYKSGEKKGQTYKKGDVIYQHPKFGEHVQTYGLTTLLHEHVMLGQDALEISFTGKKHVEQNLFTSHPVLMRYCPTGDSPDFLFLDITYHSLKKFIKKYVGSKYTPKDLRTAKVNLVFVDVFGNDPLATEFETATKKGERKKVVAEAIEQTANQIGHTKGVCRSSYLSSALLRLISEVEFNEKLKGTK